MITDVRLASGHDLLHAALLVLALPGFWDEPKRATEPAFADEEAAIRSRHERQ